MQSCATFKGRQKPKVHVKGYRVTRLQWRSRKGRSSKWIVKTRRLALYLRDNFTCQYCDKKLQRQKPKNRTLDHLVPREMGGSHSNDNLVTACLTCNTQRGLKPWEEFAGPTRSFSIRNQLKLEPLMQKARSLLHARSG